MSRTAAFYFTTLPDSYAARTGRPDNVGVIGVAVFRERIAAAIALDAASAQGRGARPSARSRAERHRRQSRQAARARRAEFDRAAAPQRALGTGHGRSEESYASYTQFERASDDAEPRRSRSTTTPTRICSRRASRSPRRPSRAGSPIPFPIAAASCRIRRRSSGVARTVRGDRATASSACDSRASLVQRAAHAGEAARRLPPHGPPRILGGPCARLRPSDEDLMLAYAAGDAAAFDALYARHKGGVYRYLLRQCRQRRHRRRAVPGRVDEPDPRARDLRAERQVHDLAVSLAHNRLIDHYRASGHVTLVSADDEATRGRSRRAARRAQRRTGAARAKAASSARGCAPRSPRCRPRSATRSCCSRKADCRSPKSRRSPASASRRSRAACATRRRNCAPSSPISTANCARALR